MTRCVVSFWLELDQLGNNIPAQELAHMAATALIIDTACRTVGEEVADSCHTFDKSLIYNYRTHC